MSKKKFNFKNYVKINGDIPIGTRLMDEHGNIPDQITEKQLDRDRVPEKDVTLEKLLEKNRTGGADILPEGRLNNEKSKLAKYRNPEAFKGDINKVEEWRLANDPVEKEKYTDASSTPKALRWWEEGKSPDGLKLASKKDTTIRKTATGAYAPDYWDDDLLQDEEREEQEPVEELTFDEGLGFGRMKDTWSEEEGLIEEPKGGEVKELENFDVIEEADGIKIIEQKDINTPVMSGVYMLLEYDPEKFNGDEDAIKDAALEAVIDIRPQLAGLITEADFMGIKEEGGVGTIALRAVGDEFASVKAEEDTESSMFSNVKIKEQDVGGTSIISGSVDVSGNVDEETIGKDVIDYLEDKFPGTGVTEESLDLSRLNEGKILFMVSPSQEVKKTKTVKDINDFPVEEVAEPVISTAQSKFKSKKK